MSQQVWLCKFKIENLERDIFQICFNDLNLLNREPMK